MKDPCFFGWFSLLFFFPKARRGRSGQLFQDCEIQLKCDDDRMSMSSNEIDEEVPEQASTPVMHHSQLSNSVDNGEYDGQDDVHDKPSKEPQLYLCDDWILPAEVMKKPCSLQQPQDKLRARVAKNFLLATLSLNVGYGSLIEDFQREPEDMRLNPPALDSISLTEEAQERCDLMERRHGDALRCIPAGLPPATLLARHLAHVSANSSAVAVVKDSNLKLYQSLCEDFPEHSYQFSCRAAD